MRIINKFCMFILFAVFFLAAKSVFAQDPLKVAPKAFKEKLNNEHVNVIEFTSKPGEKEAMHSHPDMLLYVIHGGKLKSTTADGKSQVIDYKTGDVAWRPAITHSTENVGTTEVKALLVEVKK
jgi:quercetin dioxygenase-like cupin family protein